VLAGVRGDRSVWVVWREYEIFETVNSGWRDEVLTGGRAALSHSNDGRLET
jgi:hypothetical protein